MLQAVRQLSEQRHPTTRVLCPRLHLSGSKLTTEWQMCFVLSSGLLRWHQDVCGGGKDGNVIWFFIHMQPPKDVRAHLAVMLSSAYIFTPYTLNTYKNTLTLFFLLLYFCLHRTTRATNTPHKTHIRDIHQPPYFDAAG